VNWFEEKLHSEIVDQGFAQRLKITKVIHQEETAFQQLLIFETPAFGRVLALDDIVQTTEGDEFIYHEMIVHVPMFAHGNAKRVLIIGGGDGGVLREVLRHPVERVAMIEIDQGVVNACKRYMPGLSAGAFEDERTDLMVADGIEFMARTSESFDVIIIDSTDPVGPGEVLFTDAFYADCRRRLAEGGILITQSGVPYLQGSEVTDGYRRLKPHFADVSFYVIAVPTYSGGFMTLGWATNDMRLRGRSTAEIAEGYARMGIETRYYSPEVHVAAFALPPFISRLMS
jgi:spermidine synthase